jgi:hypothetical protein
LFYLFLCPQTVAGFLAWFGERDFSEVIAVGAHFPHPTFSPELNVQLGTTRHDARISQSPEYENRKGGGAILVLIYYCWRNPPMAPMNSPALFIRPQNIQSFIPEL